MNCARSPGFHSLTLLLASFWLLSPVCAAVRCDVDFVAIKAAEITILDQGLDIYRRLVAGELAESDLSDTEIETLDEMQAILDSRSRPVDEADLAILDDAMRRLADPAAWDRSDDRRCSPDDTTVSLFCALQFASEAVVGEYQHRRTAIQEVRFAIEDFTGGREFEHRLKDFNNLPDTSLEDVLKVLETARERVHRRLDEQAACERDG